MKIVFTFILCSAIAAPAFASVSVSSPTNGEEVSSPFTLSASASECSSQAIASMGYSLDSSSSTTVFKSSSIDTKVSTTAGTHTLHVKSWGNNGASCVEDVKVTVSNVTNDVASDSSVVPSGAKSNSSIQTLGWTATKDSATSGSGSGSMSLVGTPSHSGTAREFVTHFSGSSGERFNSSFSDDTTSENFLYDTWVYLTSSASALANLEMDLNQTMANGQTAIMGFQCDGYSGTWDYTENAGTPTKPTDHWLHSGAKCNPRSWSRDAWHHVQVEYSRTSTGVVTYKAVWLDGTKQTIGATVKSAFALGWGPSINTNLQIDGLGSGTVTVYMDDMTIYRW